MCVMMTTTTTNDDDDMSRGIQHQFELIKEEEDVSHGATARNSAR
jgi:hypothetical protein